MSKPMRFSHGRRRTMENDPGGSDSDKIQIVLISVKLFRKIFLNCFSVSKQHISSVRYFSVCLFV